MWPTLRQPFFATLTERHDQCGLWDAVLFTGDLVQAGKSDEFQKMQTEVLEPLWQKLTELVSGDAVLLAAPLASFFTAAVPTRNARPQFLLLGLGEELIDGGLEVGQRNLNGALIEPAGERIEGGVDRQLGTYSVSTVSGTGGREGCSMKNSNS